MTCDGRRQQQLDSATSTTTAGDETVKRATRPRDVRVPSRRERPCCTPDVPFGGSNHADALRPTPRARLARPSAGAGGVVMTNARVNIDIGVAAARRTVATTDRYADAEAIVDRLADDGFP